MKQRHLLLTSLFSATLLLTACGGDSSSDSGFSSETSEESTESTSTSNETSLSKIEVEGLLFMREEEELARDLYLDLFDAKGLTVFQDISNNAESKHAEKMKQLMAKYGIDDPSTGERNTYTGQELQALYDELLSQGLGSDDLAALRVGALVEETDIRDINTHLDHVSAEHTDIIASYKNLLCGSRNHLRAFAEQIENETGSSYVTQVLELDTEVRAILTSDKERCGK